MTDVQAILREIVNDLEKTAAGLEFLSAQVQAIVPKNQPDLTNAVSVAVQANQNFYDGLRKKIDALQITSGGE